MHRHTHIYAHTYIHTCTQIITHAHWIPLLCYCYHYCIWLHWRVLEWLCGRSKCATDLNKYCQHLLREKILKFFLAGWQYATMGMPSRVSRPASCTICDNSSDRRMFRLYGITMRHIECYIGGVTLRIHLIFDEWRAYYQRRHLSNSKGIVTH